MSANPALSQSSDGLLPAMFVHEWLAIRRDGVEISIDGVQTRDWT